MTEHKNIHVALLAAQPKFKDPKKNAKNDHFKSNYADLKSVVDAVKPALNAEGILYFHRMDSSEVGETMVTVLHHSASGTQLEFPVPLLLSKRDMQGLKSAQTYAKRIGLEDGTGVASSEDDDAERDTGGASMGAALRDAWKQSVLDSIPENATPAEKATAFADAICADFKDKGEKALSNRWNKHKDLVGQIEKRFPELHAKIIDAYEIAVMEASGAYTRKDEMA